MPTMEELRERVRFLQAEVEPILARAWADAIENEAARVIEAQSRHVLSAEDAARFAAALDADLPPTPRALEAARAYRRRVVHAD